MAYLVMGEMNKIASIINKIKNDEKIIIIFVLFFKGVLFLKIFNLFIFFNYWDWRLRLIIKTINHFKRKLCMHLFLTIWPFKYFNLFESNL